MSARRKSPKPGRKDSAASPQPSDWEKLQSYLVPDAIDTSMFDIHPEIPEALALIKHAGPEIRYAENLAAALRLLIEATIAIAREHLYFEPQLVEPCALLGDHLHALGLTPVKGKWAILSGGPRPDTPEGRLRSILFPEHRSILSEA